MPRRRWKCYREPKFRGYQKKRSRSHRKESVRGGADPKIRMFDIGNRAKPMNTFEIVIGLIIKRSRRLSHFALEAIRVSANRRLQDAIGRDAFHMRVCVHPYDVYREHAMMAFAGADRLSSGMRKSFGRPVGRCARVHAGQVIMKVGCDLKSLGRCKRDFSISREIKLLGPVEPCFYMPLSLNLFPKSHFLISNCFMDLIQVPIKTFF